MKSTVSKKVAPVNPFPLSSHKPLSERQYLQLSHPLIGNELKKLIQKQIALDRLIIKTCRKQLDACPPGTMITCRQSDSKYSYYYNNKFPIHDNTDGDNRDPSTHPTKPKFQYISRKNLPLLRTLAQKKYAQKLLSNAEIDLQRFQDILRHIDPNYPQTVYEKLTPPYRELVIPILMTDDQYAEEWLKESYTPLSEYIGIGESFETRRGEIVRSKSELIIANALYEMGIPYKYERPLHLKTTIYPDFTVLNKRTRQVFYWEHFGMMSNMDYVQNTLQKLDLYFKSDILYGRELLFTYETDDEPLKTQHVYTLIEKYLL